ncbi:MAG: hypothetical protein CMA49_05995 [Euryarchaeota archaeon]|nr:hypothetical protein [Euryarchaeota archaeon]DAC49678.1 MAG TPA: DUF2892 domain-containing protein [Candidatus Poseidoniales archaeon]HII32750.1 DUF2892 domain-containing protein [Candidatus Poseidoniaceae archaeon]
MKNVGGMERSVRALFGSSLVLLDFFATIQLEFIFLIVGLWGVLTSAFGYCPFNWLMGRNTCSIRYDSAPVEEIVTEPF